LKIILQDGLGCEGDLDLGQLGLTVMQGA